MRPERLVVVLGTSTSVGKTWVTAKVLARLRAGGTTVAARKPVVATIGTLGQNLTGGGGTGPWTNAAIDGPSPRLGIVAAGKSYLDVRQALEHLGIDEREAARLGFRPPLSVLLREDSGRPACHPGAQPDGSRNGHLNCPMAFTVGASGPMPLPSSSPPSPGSPTTPSRPRTAARDGSWSRTPPGSRPRRA